MIWERKCYISMETLLSEIFLKEFADRFSVPEVWNYMQFHELTPFEKFKIEDYTIYPLPSRHMRTETALIYLIEHNGKTILYGNDSSMFYDEVWEFLKGRTLDCVSLDCTMGRTPSNFSHMNYEDNVAVKKKTGGIGMYNSGYQMDLCAFFA